MEYRGLGHSGLMVSELCLGCMTFGRELDEEGSRDRGSLPVPHDPGDAAGLEPARFGRLVTWIDTASTYP